MLAVHAAVLPLDAQRALVADVVERDDDLLEVDVAVAEASGSPSSGAGRRTSVCPPNTPTRAVAVPHQTSFMWTWKMRSPNVRMNFDVVDALVAEVATGRS